MTLLMSTHNICFHGGIRKNINLIPLLLHPLISRDMVSLLKLSFSCFSFAAKYVVDSHYNNILEVIPMSTHNIYFAAKMTKNITKIIFLSMVANYSSVAMTGCYSPNIEQNIGTRGKINHQTLYGNIFLTFFGENNEIIINLSSAYFRLFVLRFVLRFYGPVKPVGSCRTRSIYLTTRLRTRQD